MPAGKPDPSTKRHRIIRKKQSEKFSRYFLLTILIAVMVLFFKMVSIFLLPVVLAAVFTTLFYPLYNYLVKLLRQHRAIAALLCCLLLFTCLLIPLYIAGNLITHQAIQFYQSIQKNVNQALQDGQPGPLSRLKESAIVRSLHLENLNWDSIVKDAAANTGRIVARVIGKTSGTAVQAIANIFITLFVMFYFFRDGEILIPRIKYLIPLSNHYIDELLVRFANVSRATIRGTLLIGLTQSTIGAITLWICGIPSPALWWIVMMILSQIPVIGAWVVMHPAGIFQLATGHIWQGIVIIAITLGVISTIDNVMRPRLVGQRTGIHDLIIFFSALGGIRMFGPMGVIVGPVIAAFFVAILDIYSMEFKSHLEDTQKGGSIPPE